MSRRDFLIGFVVATVLSGGLAWGVINKFDIVDLTTGLRIGGAATSGRYLRGDGTNFVQSSVAAAGAGTCTNQFVRATVDNAAPTCAAVDDASLASSYSGVGTCTNQFARVLNDNAAPTCATVALTTDTSGNYALGDAEGGNAVTGDTATAFFSAGQIEAARGGTGDDTSASTGVPRIATGNWTYDAGVSHLAASTSADLLGVLSDETGSGLAVFATSPSIASPSLTGDPTAPTASAADADTSIATTAFVPDTSAEMATRITDETGSGALTFATSPTFTTKFSLVASAALIELDFTGGGTNELNLHTDEDFTIELDANNDASNAGLFIANGAGTQIHVFREDGAYVSAGTGNLGWTVQSAANQSCTTTCTNGACVFGFDDAGIAEITPVACGSALADVCLCAG